MKAVWVATCLALMILAISLVFAYMGQSALSVLCAFVAGMLVRGVLQEIVGGAWA